MASSYVGGLSGAFIPVSEDQGMINAVNAGALCIEKLEAMTCVCSVGLLGYAPIMPVNQFDCSAFVNRKGRIPAPIHSFKN